MTDRASQLARGIQRYYPRVPREMQILYLSGIERLDGTGAVTSCENSKHLDAARPPARPVSRFYARDSAKLSRPATGGPGSLGVLNIRAEIYKPTEKFGSKINNDIKSPRGVVT